MPAIHIHIVRDLGARSSRDGARFRVKLYAQCGGPALLSSTMACTSVSSAKIEAEALFGALDWREGVDPVRLTAVVEL